MQNFQFYICPDGHQLTWSKGYIDDCGLCGKIVSTMTRFSCTTCSAKYCVKCVKPPCMGDFCGGGHPMKQMPKLSGHSCDVCRKGIQGGGFRCQTCDYDVCDDCHIVKED